MLLQLLLTMAVLGALMGGWLGLQAWVRRGSPELTPDCDVLHGRWGCHGCSLSSACNGSSNPAQSPTPKS